jgi:NAD(P)-dependent dehydrogenase (short-subunit alcohol dehydrogenase family)
MTANSPEGVLAGLHRAHVCDRFFAVPPGSGAGRTRNWKSSAFAISCCSLRCGTDSIRSAIQETVSRFGKLDVLYNCAGASSFQDAPVTEVDMSVWQQTISFDLLGTFHCCRHGIPELAP